MSPGQKYFIYLQKEVRWTLRCDVLISVFLAAGPVSVQAFWCLQIRAWTFGTTAGRAAVIFLEGVAVPLIVFRKTHGLRIEMLWPS